jgi:excisionase family DNA binding protein
MSDEVLLRVPEVAERLAMSVSWVNARIADGSLRSVLLSSRARRVPESAVREFVAKQEERA